MDYRPEQPLVVQSDFTVLLEIQNLRGEEASILLSRFADLVKSPEHVHTYRITSLSLWNAAAAGLKSDDILNFLQQYSKFSIPLQVRSDIARFMNRFGQLRLMPSEHAPYLKLVSDDLEVMNLLSEQRSLQAFIVRNHQHGSFEVLPIDRGRIKQELIRLGYPVLDLVGYHEGETLDIELKSHMDDSCPFELRPYQQKAVDSFYQEGSVYGGSGVLVLPCGAGKTVIGIAAMARLNCAVLILTTNVTSVRQWIREIMDKTNLLPEQVGEYTGDRKEVKPVTIATYQILTHRKTKQDEFVHMKLFNERDWGLIIYDEVHLLPAPVFRVTADIQATRRLGLTATLVREDGQEEDVFTLVGPKRFDMPWKELEGQGWIARVTCFEIRVPMSLIQREHYVHAEGKQKFRIAGENPLKLNVIEDIMKLHQGRSILIIGQYLDQLKHISQALEVPMISGQMPHDERDALYERFRSGELPILIVSKVANFAVDLPDASVAIQISGSYGSRQEEAQRLGRILRPKAGENTAYFYTLVSKDSKEQEFAMNRQLFLVEKGYRYHLEDAVIFTPEVAL